MLKCKHGCGFEAETKRKLHPHEQFHCPKIKQTGKGKKKVSPCDCADGGDWALLNRREHPEEVAQGYRKYCTKCKEVV